MTRLGPRRRTHYHGTSRRTWDSLASRGQAARKVNHDPRFPGVLVLEAVSANA